MTGLRQLELRTGGRFVEPPIDARFSMDIATKAGLEVPGSDPSRLQVMCLVKRWEHHTASGGYDCLARALGAETVRRRTDRKLLRRIAAFAWRRLSHPKPYLLDYRYEDWLSELYALWRGRFRSPDLVHLLYGDEQLDLLLRRRHLLRCPLVVSFHLPPYRVQDRFENIQKHLLSGIDMAVVVGTNQLESFQKWLGKDRVVYVPHGIDVDRFCPGEPANDNHVVRLLTVGHHMRDWETIEKVIEQCRARGLSVRFDIVSSENHLGSSAMFPEVYIHSGISEEELIQMYRAADSLLLPLHEATANNSTLESLACGTPVISTRVGGIPDYVDDTCGWLFEKGEVKPIVDLVETMCSYRNVARSRRQPARDKALTFCWQSVASRMRAAYDTALAHHTSRQSIQ
jgi:glycosyltransferase involved in cell wall biosynthesis